MQPSGLELGPELILLYDNISITADAPVWAAVLQWLLTPS